MKIILTLLLSLIATNTFAKAYTIRNQQTGEVYIVNEQQRSKLIEVEDVKCNNNLDNCTF